ncbi:MAG TPA: PLP-dependent transferase [Trueperaceae bacterium]
MTRRPAPSPETELLRDPEAAGSADVVPALHQTSLFTFDTFADMRATLEAGTEARYVYSRGRNPTVEAFERKVASLERAEDAVAFASGMAAIAAVLLTNLRAGDRVVCVRHVYPDAHGLMTRLLPRFGVATRFVDGTDVAAVADALRGGYDAPPAALLYLESPTTLLFELQDLAALAAAAREVGALTVMDNSWATPLGQRPVEHGVDLVLHSASKYLSGHSDVVAGVVAGRRELVDRLRSDALMLLGGKLAPFEAWLLLRGLRTLPVRLERHGRSALAVARALREHQAVQAVHYPALEDHPQRDLFGRYLTAASGLLSFELADEGLVEPFVDELRLFRLGVSWGGYESLVYPALLGHLTGAPDGATRYFAVPRSLVRLHVGLEDPDDLVADLLGALERSLKRAG